VVWREDGPVTTPDPSTTAVYPLGLAQHLDAASQAIEQTPPSAPAVLRLAQAFGGFYLARAVSVILAAEAGRHRDAYDLAVGWGTQALQVLSEAIGSRLAAKYAPDHGAGDRFFRDLAHSGQVELHTAAEEDVDRIAAAMVSLASRLLEILAGVAEDQAALPQLRAAAQAVTPAAHNTWAHYGGDSGGW
jgi:hypothetical protein